MGIIETTNVIAATEVHACEAPDCGEVTPFACEWNKVWFCIEHYIDAVEDILRREHAADNERPGGY